MPSFRTRHRVPFTPRQMFDLVKDVERYPEFLPMCEAITVRRRDTADGHEVLTVSAGAPAKPEPLAAAAA